MAKMGLEVIANNVAGEVRLKFHRGECPNFVQRRRPVKRRIWSDLIWSDIENYPASQQITMLPPAFDIYGNDVLIVQWVATSTIKGISKSSSPETDS